jgi:hypothetical protein
MYVKKLEYKEFYINKSLGLYFLFNLKNYSYCMNTLKN